MSEANILENLGEREQKEWKVKVFVMGIKMFGMFSSKT